MPSREPVRIRYTNASLADQVALSQIGFGLDGSDAIELDGPDVAALLRVGQALPDDHPALPRLERLYQAWTIATMRGHHVAVA